MKADRLRAGTLAASGEAARRENARATRISQLRRWQLADRARARARRFRVLSTDFRANKKLLAVYIKEQIVTYHRSTSIRDTEKQNSNDHS